MDTTYEAPILAEIGTLHELTMQKQLGGFDGTTFVIVIPGIGPITVPIPISSP